MSLQDWMDPHRRNHRASSFGPAATLYNRVRPSYPTEAVEWALRPLRLDRARVADVGAGTGIMSRLIASLGHEVVAIEPDALMRELCAATASGVEVHAGSAESVPLPDASVDAAVAAQAYHWFDPARSHAELARIIRPGGIFAAIWNDRDENTAWVLEYSHIVEGDRAPDGSGADIARADSMSFGDRFATVDAATFTHTATHTPDSLVDLLKSRSYYLTATPERQTALEHEVRDLAETHPDLTGRAEFPMPYLTRVYRGVRVAP